jgi:hypothetical protein
MKAEDTQGWVGKVVQDTYGRTLGRAVGLVFDVSGEVSAIGVEEAGSFKELRAEQVVSDREELEVIPVWKVDSRRVGLEGASLERRLSALEGMLERREVSRAAYDALYSNLVSVRETHEQVKSRVLMRLDELLHEDESVDAFLTMVRLQFHAGEISEESFNLTVSQCDSMKAANAKEVVDIRRTLGDPRLGEVENVALSRRMRLEPEAGTVAAELSRSDIGPNPAPEKAKTEEAQVGGVPRQATAQPAAQDAPDAGEPRLNSLKPPRKPRSA